jgi:hypothetical protein
MPPITSIVEQIRLVNQWMPVLGFGQRWLAEQDAARRSLIVADLAEWLASKTETRLDDQLVDHVAAILKTPEGEALVRFVVSFGEAAAAAAAAAEGQR